MSWICMLSFSFVPLMTSEEKIFEWLFENLPFMLPWQPIKFNDIDKIHMTRRGLLKKHFCRKKSKYLQWDSKNCHFPLFPLMETISCHSNQSSYPIGTKKHNCSFTPPINARCEIWKESASEEKSIENVDGRTTDACLYYKLTFGSGELIMRPLTKTYRSQ